MVLYFTDEKIALLFLSLSLSSLLLIEIFFSLFSFGCCIYLLACFVVFFFLFFSSNPGGTMEPVGADSRPATPIQNKLTAPR